MHYVHYLLIFIVVGFSLFGSVLHRGFVLDDKKQIVTNTRVHSVSGIPYFFNSSLRFFNEGNLYSYTYRPFFYSSYSIFYFIGKGEPFIFHFSQILIYSFNCFLVFLFFSRFFENKLAFALALIFLSHPVNEEVAAYIADFQDVLYFFFGIMALILVIKTRNINIKSLLIVTALFLLSLLSKESAVLFIFLTILYVILFKRKHVKYYLLSSFLVTISYFFLRLNAAGTTFMEVAGKTVSIHEFNFLERLIISPKIIAFYIQDLFMPLPELPSVSYLKSVELIGSIGPFFVVFSFFSSLLLIGFILFKRRNNLFKEYAFFFIWFFAGIILHSQLIPLDIVIAKRFLYFTLVGFLGVFGIIYRTVDEYFLKNKTRKIALLLYSFYVLILIAETLYMNTVW